MRLGAGPGAALPRALEEADPRLRPGNPHAARAVHTRAAARARRPRRRSPSAAQAPPGAPPVSPDVARDARTRHGRIPDGAPRPRPRPGGLLPARPDLRELRVGRPGSRLSPRGARRAGRGPRMLQRRLRALGRRADGLREERRPRPPLCPRAPGQAAGGELPALLRPAPRVGRRAPRRLKSRKSGHLAADDTVFRGARARSEFLVTAAPGTPPKA